MPDYAFPARLQLRLDWSELDLFGHVNNVSYFKYLQASRLNYWEKLGLTLWFKDRGIGPILASTRCEFRKPLNYPGSITVRVSVAEMRHTSFSLYHQVIDEAGDIAAEGYDVVVLYDYRKNEKYALPDELRRQVEAAEGRSFAAREEQ
jgi:acyl-CoA thioester hydrolase